MHILTQVYVEEALKLFSRAMKTQVLHLGGLTAILGPL